MQVPSLRDDSLDVVRHLIKDIGPRRATSLEEAQAAAYVDGRLRRAGMRVGADTFRAPTHPHPAYILTNFLGIAAALLTGWFPLPSLLLAVWGVGLALGIALAGPPPFLAIRRDSQNIVGTRASEKAPRWRVVLLAPLDSAPQREGLHMLTGSQRTAFFGQMVAFGLIALLSLLHYLYPEDNWWYGQALPAVYLLLTSLFLRQHIGSAPGGAGALAVLLSAAERLSTLRHVELWMVALGATATSNSGVHNLLARYPFPKQKTLILALETIDSGHLTYVSREGILQQYAADSLLMQSAAVVDANDPLINAEPRPYRQAPSIAAPLHARGHRVMTILTAPDWHGPAASTNRHLPGQFDPELLERATRLVAGIVQQLNDAQLATDA